MVAQLVKNPPAMQETLVWFLGGKNCPQNGIGYPPLQYSWASLVTQTVKNLSVKGKTWVRSLGWEDPLLKGTATHSSILAWRIPMDRGAWWAIVHGVAKSLMWPSDWAWCIAVQCEPSHSTWTQPSVPDSQVLVFFFFFSFFFNLI